MGDSWEDNIKVYFYKNAIGFNSTASGQNSHSSKCNNESFIKCREFLEH
jgi:hypothetical protein